ncbi:adenylate/guanylate cyclase domain-containing protein [Cohaesibacter intestini]|uniref:adenylate/guanylate cyclase domain-containing protein n=1 Tax=Cohaesibacter intestini TaxID=2211145 RepID=UPI001300384D|nr:adenylate/guanylate cyclase domain-containing protein [Cohaesibacter intestini]
MIGTLRLTSGLILFLFVSGHFINHAVGITTIEAMNAVSAFTITPWRTLPGTILLSAALVTHGTLAVWSVIRRRTLRTSLKDWIQLTLGFLIPLLIASHVFATRITYEVYGYSERYSYELWSLWVASPQKAITLCVALLVVWTHGCIGWHNWLSTKSWYLRNRNPALFIAILVPALALAGLISGRYRIIEQVQEPGWLDAVLAPIRPHFPGMAQMVFGGEFRVRLVTVAIIVTIILYHLIRWVLNAQKAKTRLHYRNPQTGLSADLNMRPDMSLLDTIRSAGIAHASVCGGRGRCSTCRVRIDHSLTDMPPPDATEQKVLERISAPPNVRLACQLFPPSPLSVTALLGPNPSAKDAGPQPRHHAGMEQDLVILFADLRGFTKLSESRLPYDVAYLLNRYFAAMGTAIEASGGHLDKFIGDGVMALFGIDGNIESASRQAIAATMRMARNLDKLNEDLATEMNAPLKIGIGLHSGLSIVGNMGFRNATSITAIGDVVNTASRLESLSKDHDAQLIISERTARYCGHDLSGFPLQSVTLRGRQDALEVRVIGSALKIPPAPEPDK